MEAHERKPPGTKVDLEVEDDVRIPGATSPGAARAEVVDILTCAIVRLVLDGRYRQPAREGVRPGPGEREPDAVAR
jgi:hypothetical protein